MLFRRAIFLLVIGLLHTPIWPARPDDSGVLAVTLVVGFALMLLGLDYDFGWGWKTLSCQGFWTPAGVVRHMFFNGFDPGVPWLAYLFAGMALGRQYMSDALTRRRVFFMAAGVAIVAEAVSWLLLRDLAFGARFGDRETAIAIFGTGPMPPMPLYMIAAAGTARAVIAASISLVERYRDSMWLRPLVATGQLALTLYLGHVVVGMGSLEAIGGLENQPLPFAVSAPSRSVLRASRSLISGESAFGVDLSKRQ